MIFPFFLTCGKMIFPEYLEIQYTLDNSNCQGAEEKVRVVESSSFREVGLNQGKLFG